MAELVITLADGRVVHHVLTQRPAVIGRDATCEIPLDDPSASRRHARFSATPHGYVVEDMGSKNGTTVNDVPCTSRLLKVGDRVQVGSSVAVLMDSDLSRSGSVVIADEPTTSHATRYISRDQRLLLSQQRLEMLYALSERLTTLQSRQKLLETAMDICFETLRFERGAIGVRRKSSRVLDWPVVRNLRGAEGELTISRSLLMRALEHGERAIFSDEGAGAADPTVSMVQHGIRSAMCVPLPDQKKTMGVIYGDRISTSASYHSEDIDFLAAIAKLVSIGLLNCNLLEDQEQMIRMERELELARAIQSGLLPKQLPSGRELTIAALNDPGDRISGDYYDVIPSPDGRLWCLMADVTGEGVSAALLMANLQAAVRVTVEQEQDPGSLLAIWNRLIFRNTDTSKFVTCLLALIDPKQRNIQLACAGHCLPLVMRGSGKRVEQIETDSGLPLGVVEETPYNTTTESLGPEPFTYFCYTDGVIEAMNGEFKVFGQERLLQALAETDGFNPRKLVKHVRSHVTNFASGAKQSDDITMLAVRVG